jgi:integrase
MSAVVAARTVAPVAAVAPAGGVACDVFLHVFGDGGAGEVAGEVYDEQTARLARMIDPRFLAECGWDPAGRVLAPRADHPQLRSDRVGPAPVVAAGAAGCAVSGCAVSGCARPAGSHGLCRTHRRGQLLRGVSVAEFTADPARRALSSFGRCQVAACPQERRGGRVAYCETHQARWTRDQRADPGLDEAGWRAITAPIVVTGQVSLAGLAPLLTAQVLYGLQQRTRTGAQTRLHVLRAVVQDLRRARADTVHAAVDPSPGMRREKRTVLAALARHSALATADPETEKAKHVWELAVFGLPGRLSFTAICQPWLRETVKRWAADELPRHRGAGAGRVLRALVGSVAHLSRSLRGSRPDHGDRPAALGRGDIESFLHRLAYLASTGEISPELRAKICRDVKRVLGRIRALGLTRPDGPAAGLGSDFTLAFGDVPAEPERGEPGRNLPPAIMAQLCAQLPLLEHGPSGPEIRVAVELLTDTGRRPQEILRLPLDCLTRDPDGAAVLVYDNHKRDRRERRLPISQPTAEVITTQQARVRDRFPNTPPAELVLLPTPHANPTGRKPISSGLLDLRHRTWVDQLPVLRGEDGTEFDKSKIVPYAYRHSFAQRHADAGVAIDVLSQLLDHRTLEVTRRYYRVGEHRRRAAVDAVTAHSFDRHGNRIWRDAHAMLDTEHARYAVGDVAVPYGRCTEPANVAAGGGACPVRFRCAGCDHFRTDVSHLPELTGYLEDLLRTRERLAATIDGIDEWARADATPTAEEITRIRRLINRITGDIAGLDQTQQAQIADAVAVLRRHRAAHPVALGLPTLRAAAPAPPTVSEATT